VLADFASHDRKSDWNDSVCTSVAAAFVKSANVPEARYNAGLTHQRCDQHAQAKEEFQAALRLDPKLARARAQLALYEFESSKDLDGTIRKLDGIIRDGKFQTVEGLVALAALQMERNGDAADDEGKNDMERARKNLQRALAIDDGYMAAVNQLAIFYLEQAKHKTGQKKRKHAGLIAGSGKRTDASSQQLDLAALVASQGIRKNPSYAPLHNTAGLVQVELRNFNSAVRSFATARRLDPRFFEAHMNYAAVNLGFRGFEEAEKAYRDALKVRPKEYEAHLGLALSLRGQIRPGDPAGLATKVEASLTEARKVAPNRAETYYNEAILTHEFKAKGEEKAAIPMLKKASGLYREFIARAGTDPAFADAVKRAQERREDIDVMIDFIEKGSAKP
jgi:tetratricopeptide (TPR) repeat protein